MGETNDPRVAYYIKIGAEKWLSRLPKPVPESSGQQYLCACSNRDIQSLSLQTFQAAWRAVMGYVGEDGAHIMLGVVNGSRMTIMIVASIASVYGVIGDLYLT